MKAFEWTNQRPSAEAVKMLNRRRRHGDIDEAPRADRRRAGPADDDEGLHRRGRRAWSISRTFAGSISITLNAQAG